jgi:hypothetical protein
MNARAVFLSLSLGIASSSFAFAEATLFEEYEKKAIALAEQVGTPEPNLNVVDGFITSEDQSSIEEESMEVAQHVVRIAKRLAN